MLMYCIAEQGMEVISLFVFTEYVIRLKPMDE